MPLPKVPERTRPSFVFSLLERSLQDCLGKRKFGKHEIGLYLNFFEQAVPECAYCGSIAVQRWDHIVPLLKGGETVLGNMVLACAQCDDTKRDLSLEEWMGHTAPWSLRGRGIQNIEQRLARIQDYIVHFGYLSRPLKERLTASEQERLMTIRATAQSLRLDIEALINEHSLHISNP
jgi:hypothetical protein